MSKAAYRKENKARAERVRDVLAKQWNAEKSGDEESALVDLLADIRHFCDLRGIAFHEVDRSAYRHYSAEVVQARTGVEQ